MNWNYFWPQPDSSDVLSHCRLMSQTSQTSQTNVCLFRRKTNLHSCFSVIFQTKHIKENKIWPNANVKTLPFQQVFKMENIQKFINHRRNEGKHFFDMFHYPLTLEFHELIYVTDCQCVDIFHHIIQNTSKLDFYRFDLFFSFAFMSASLKNWRKFICNLSKCRRTFENTAQLQWS